jgi:lactoylglutathione lyase
MRQRIDMIGIFVKDIARMVSFYRDVLCFECDWKEGPYAEFKHDGVRFSFYERDKLPELLSEPVTFPSGLNGTFEIAIELPRFEDVDPEYKRVVKAGATPVQPPRDEPWGMRSSMVADPEGNLIEIGSSNRENSQQSPAGDALKAAPEE